MQTYGAPADGDIVVRREHRSGTIVYVLHTAPGPDECLLSSCEEAVAQAVMMAKRQDTRAWFTTDEGYGFLPLGASFGVSHDQEFIVDPTLAECDRHLHRLVDRLYSEYLEMPGLRLTIPQAQRLCGVGGMICQMVLDALVDEKFLRVNRDGTYGRLADGDQPRPAQAKLRARLRPATKAS